MRTSVQPFYSSTIPSDWTTPEFGRVFSFLQTFPFSREQLSSEPTLDGVRNIHYGDIHAVYENEILDLATETRVPFLQDGLIDPERFRDEEFPALKDGDLVIADVSEDYEGICEAIELQNLNGAKVIGGLHTFAARASENDVAMGLRTYLLRHPQVIRELRRLATGISVFGVSKNNLSRIKVALPPHSEQKGIAHLLGLMDEAIKTNGRLTAQKELRKKWLMQNLLTGKKRLAGFGDEWSTLQLREVAREATARNTANHLSSDSLMAVTKERGLVPMRERVQGESVARCKLIEKDTFAYNPMRLNIGSIARWSNDEPAMVSGDYVVFRCREDHLDPDYLDFFRQTHAWSHFVKRAGDGSVRVRIYFSHLGHMKLTVPPLAEQRAIAAVLLSSQKEIELLRAKDARLRDLKIGMMQQLLTGKKRLKFVTEN